MNLATVAMEHSYMLKTFCGVMLTFQIDVLKFSASKFSGNTSGNVKRYCKAYSVDALDLIQFTVTYSFEIKMHWFSGMV